MLDVESLTLTKMDRLTITQRIKIIKTNYKNSDSTYRALREDVKKFEETGVSGYKY